MQITSLLDHRNELESESERGDRWDTLGKVELGLQWL
jgi:hypothetical protein